MIIKGTLENFPRLNTTERKSFNNSMDMKFLILILTVLCVTNLVKCEMSSKCVDQETSILPNPYLKIRDFFNVSSEKDLTDFLQNVSYHYYGGVHCEKKDGNSQICQACLNATDLIAILNTNFTDGIKQEDFINMATVLLLHVFSGEFCNGSKDVITKENMTVDDIQVKLVNSIVKNAGRADIEAADLEDVLKKYLKQYSEIDPIHTDEHRIKPVKDNCVSPDLLLEQLGGRQGDHVQKDDVGNLAALLIYHIVTGSKVTERCRNLPRPSYFVDELFQDAETMSEEYFLTTILGSLRPTITSGTTDVHEKQWNRCFSGEELLSIFSVPEGGSITKTKFAAICPALLQEKINGACDSSHEAHVEEQTVSDAQRYGYATVAVVLVCLCSILGAVFLPLAKRSVFQILMEVFKGLAVGTLVTDPILHLLPEVFGVHDHDSQEEADHEHSAGPIVVEEYIWYGMVTIAGIYLFYLLELSMGWFQISKSGNNASEDDFHHSHDVEISVIANGKQDMSTASSQAQMCESENSDVSLSESEIKKEIAPLALMVIIGDAIHNFADGLAIGAAFTQGVTVGIATTIAVLCHELPHEFGDFAVLLSSGFTVARALFWNLMSSLTALLGLYLGLGVSVHASTRNWIFSVTSGLFLYIALADLIPDLLHKNRRKRSFRIAIYNNVGMFIGAAILIILAIFEESINL
ncbi:hypothetical protein CHS0354_027335 [Potamilus streckersoni]|uniref:Zinc transporter ZIP4 n=1 Tax=Potamilus streckersoni TaxID=2493646 RepID=A0AAE0SC46_9BIVA|nr:hypothetical protein CHS0354_027335 [Potamilus streckersoni]